MWTITFFNGKISYIYKWPCLTAKLNYKIWFYDIVWWFIIRDQIGLVLWLNLVDIRVILVLIQTLAREYDGVWHAEFVCFLNIVTVKKHIFMDVGAFISLYQIVKTTYFFTSLCRVPIFCCSVYLIYLNSCMYAI